MTYKAFTSMAILLLIAGILLLSAPMTANAQNMPLTRYARLTSNSMGMWTQTDATWTMPPNSSGTYRVELTANVTGYAFTCLMSDNTGNHQVLSRSFTQSLPPCDDYQTPTVTLESGHTYTMSVAEPMGPGPLTDIVVAQAKIFYECNKPGQ
jgi:hypothetical protein